MKQVGLEQSSPIFRHDMVKAIQSFRKIFLLFAVVLFSVTTIAQDYQNAVGLRGGYVGGITFKHFLGESKAVDGILSFRQQGVLVTGLYEIHKNAFEVERLNWYYGYGAHVGIWGANTERDFYPDGGPIIGIDGVIGIEYYISEIPFTIGVDWKPAINLIGRAGFWAEDAALSVRYVF